MPEDIFGLTISNGDIFIRGDFLQEALGETKECKLLQGKKKQYYILTAVCKIFLTLLHEYAHKIHYLVRKNNNNYNNQDIWLENFFDHSEEVNINNNFDYFKDLQGRKDLRIQKNQNQLHLNEKFNEQGTFFDKELYIREVLDNVIEEAAHYFLFEQCDNIKKMKELQDDTKNKTSNRSSNTKYKSSTNNKLPRCYFSIIRHC